VPIISRKPFNDAAKQFPNDQDALVNAFIEFRDSRMYVKHISSHAEYDRLTDKYRRNKE